MCYNAVAADAASVTLKGSVINRNQFGVSVAENVKADVRSRTIFARNGIAMVANGARIHVDDPANSNAAIVRSSPSIVSFNGSLRIGNMVADTPSSYLGPSGHSGTSGSVSASGNLSPNNPGSTPLNYTIYAANSNVVMDYTYSQSDLQIPVVAFNTTNLVAKSSSKTDDARTVVGTRSFINIDTLSFQQSSAKSGPKSSTTIFGNKESYIPPKV